MNLTQRRSRHRWRAPLSAVGRTRLIVAAVVVLAAVLVPMTLGPMITPEPERTSASDDPESSPTPTGYDEDYLAPPGARGRPPEVSPAPGGPPPASDEEVRPSHASPCGEFPSFPDETCTGWRHTGVELRLCPNEIDESNVTLDGCRFEGTLTVRGSDVTITRSLVIGGNVRRVDDQAPLTLIDVEIDGSGREWPNNESALSGYNYSCIRCHIHSTSRGVQLHNNVRIEGSYIHGFPYLAGAHKTAVGAHGGRNLTVIHNNLDCDIPGCSAALSLYGDFAPIENVLIAQNLFNTVGSYCTYGGSVGSKPYPVGTDIRYLDNRFGKLHSQDCGMYGPVTSFDSRHRGNRWEGNEWADGSGEVTPD